MTERAFSLSIQFEPITCCHAGCGLVFAVPEWWVSKRRLDKTTWYCPNGHQQGFYGDNEVDRLKKELRKRENSLEATESARRFALGRLETEIRRSRALRGSITKIKKRTANGVCPCCTRSFANLRRHITTKHPDYPGES